MEGKAEGFGDETTQQRWKRDAEKEDGFLVFQTLQRG